MRFCERLLVAAFPLALAACGGADGEPVPEQTDQQVDGQVAQAAPAPRESEPDQVPLPKAFLSRDCATVAAAYSKALSERDFLLAARAWAEPVSSDALALRFDGYGSPSFNLGQTKEEGAAGSLYCEMTATLRDSDAPQRPLRQGTITFRRANDVPGASADQLRWRIIDSTIAETMPRMGEGAPA